MNGLAVAVAVAVAVIVAVVRAVAGAGAGAAEWMLPFATCLREANVNTISQMSMCLCALQGCEDHDNQQNCCGPCNVTKYGVGKLVDLYTSSGPALGQNGTNNGFLFTSAAVRLYLR